MDRTPTLLVTLAFALLLLPATGCLFGQAINNIIDEVQEDIDHFCETAADQEGARSEFLGESAGSLFGTGAHVFWLDFSQWDPTLHSDGPGGTTHYDFAISQDGLWNVRASDDLIVTAVDEYGQIRYRAFATGAAEELVGEAVFPAPGDEQRWWAYAVDGETVYVMTTGEATTLWAWLPGTEPVEVTTLESAGASVGEFWEFGVDGHKLAFVESGRLWVMELSTNTATWTENGTHATDRVHMEDAGVLFDTAAGPHLYHYADGRLEDIGRSIEESGYYFNGTYVNIHEYQGGLTWTGSAMIYEGSHGLFVYDLFSGDLQPLLLEPCSDEVRIEYRDPVFRADGALFVTGLTSTSGAVGADGPVYRVDTAGLLP